jgi:hypothetical protein
MVQLTGMAVTLATANDSDSGTPDQLYIGVIGSGGGREFPLLEDAEIFNAAEGKKFALGLIWEGSFIDGATKFPLRSKPGKDNDPALIPVDVDRVGFVYLRKQGDNTFNGDNGFQLFGLRVVLYGPTAPSKRLFEFLNGAGNPLLWLANENGHVVYLQEKASVSVSPSD